jgi:ribosomal protein S18 acetylase RimI-like enzyme
MSNNIFAATEQDSEWIAAIQSECGLPLWNPNSTSWVLEKKAYAIWLIASDSCELLSVAVALAEQGKGLAKMLIEHSHKELAMQGVNHFFLEVRESNANAISLYKKIGYEINVERKAYYANGENALVMSFSRAD